MDINVGFELTEKATNELVEQLSTRIAADVYDAVIQQLIDDGILVEAEEEEEEEEYLEDPPDWDVTPKQEATDENKCTSSCSWYYYDGGYPISCPCWSCPNRKPSNTYPWLYPQTTWTSATAPSTKEYEIWC